jgi:spermidine synthase
VTIVSAVTVSFERAALGVAVFISGAVLLGVEIAASRVVAPYFGSSLYVWGALIGVVLTGLAIGYWLGGALADRRPTPVLLLATLALGALLVLAIPLVDQDLLRAVGDWDPGPRLSPLVAAAILFGPMSVVLAGVTPIAVRINARSIDTLGRTAGRLFALSTVGSIVGTFATAFVLVPELGTNQLLGLGAAALFGAVMVVAAGSRLPVATAAAAAAVAGTVILSAALAPDGSGTIAASEVRNYSPVYRLRGGVAGNEVDFEAEGLEVVYRKDTAYHSLAVVDDTDSRYLRFDSSFQSGMYLDNPFATNFEYTDYFHLGLAYNPRARNLLFIGLGGASAPKRLWRDFPNLDIQTVELDPVVRDVAYRYFRLPRDPRLRVEVEDGRRYLEKTDRRWDVIAIDAYYSDAIPFHLTTHEFMELARSRLAPGGVIVANVIGALRGGQSQLFRSFYRTYRSVFPTVVVHPVMFRGDRSAFDVRNLIVVAGDSPAPSKQFLLERWREIRGDASKAPDLSRAIRNRDDRVVQVDDVPLLTDDYAPTDALLVTG